MKKTTLGVVAVLLGFILYQLIIVGPPVPTPTVVGRMTPVNGIVHFSMAPASKDRYRMWVQTQQQNTNDSWGFILIDKDEIGSAVTAEGVVHYLHLSLMSVASLADQHYEKDTLPVWTRDGFWDPGTRRYLGSDANPDKFYIAAWQDGRKLLTQTAQNKQ